MTTRRKRESAREALRSRTDITSSTSAAERVTPSPAASEQTPTDDALWDRTDLIGVPPLAADNLPSSPPANEQSPSLLEQATGMLSWDQVKDLIRISRGIGTPGQELQDLARRIVGHTQIQTVEENELLEIFGTKDRYFARGLIGQLLKMGSMAGDTRNGGDGYDFAVSFLKGMKPKDQIAAMLLTQMAATHMAIIEHVNRLAQAKHIEHHDMSDRTLGKMLRIFVTQVEVFERYQNGGHQKASVQNVSLNQAIVTNVGKDAVGRGEVSHKSVEHAAETPALTHSKEQPIKQSGDLARDLEREYETIEHATGKKLRS